MVVVVTLYFESSDIFPRPSYSNSPRIDCPDHVFRISRMDPWLMSVIVGGSIFSRCGDCILFDGCRHSDHIQSYQCGKSFSDQSSEIEQLFLLISIVTGSLRQCR